MIICNYVYLPTNTHWARVGGYGLFSLCVIHKEDLCPSSGDINRLMMMMCIYSKPLLTIEMYSNKLYQKHNVKIKTFYKKSYKSCQLTS
jgi:hypothetical protein